mmetsp:Transcript_12430/g.43869  ORF Transcript_12430/g.43869 Transcript_12430/m.43869 type:complete len:259 (+) Transcript_12430:1441-2217(+)
MRRRRPSRRHRRPPLMPLRRRQPPRLRRRLLRRPRQAARGRAATSPPARRRATHRSYVLCVPGSLTDCRSWPVTWPPRRGCRPGVALPCPNSRAGAAICPRKAPPRRLRLACRRWRPRLCRLPRRPCLRHRRPPALPQPWPRPRRRWSRASGTSQTRRRPSRCRRLEARRMPKNATGTRTRARRRVGPRLARRPPRCRRLEAQRMPKTATGTRMRARRRARPRLTRRRRRRCPPAASLRTRKTPAGTASPMTSVSAMT